MGVGFQGGTDLGFMIAFAMTLHNVPEGIGIGAPLKKRRLVLSFHCDFDSYGRSCNSLLAQSLVGNWQVFPS